jgi:hypothetical protein
MMSPRAGTLAILFAGAALAGCYAYVPVRVDEPEPGAQVRADVTTQAASKLTSTLGPGVTQLRGMVIERDPSQMSLILDSYSTARSGSLAGTGEPVHVAIDGIRNLETKRLSRGRSVLLGIAFVGGAVALTNLLTGEGRVLDDQVDEDPGPTQRRGIPGIVGAIFRVRFP